MTENSNPSSSGPRTKPVPREKLVKVFDSERESEALVVSGLLESAGIDSDVTSTDAAQDMFPGVGGSVILVREEQADEARRIIQEYRRSDDTPEIDLNEEPPPAN
jgi:Putative prokaryotic signal transducing protein